MYVCVCVCVCVCMTKDNNIIWITLMVLDPETFYNNSLSTIATAAIAKIQLNFKEIALFEIS